MKKVTVLDIIITFIFISGVFLLVFYQFILSSNSGTILLIQTPTDSYYYSIDQKKTLEINGDNGKTIINIEDSKFRFYDSPCMNKDCVRMGWISRHNYPVICLPNKVSAYIVNDDIKLDYDGISR